MSSFCLQTNRPQLLQATYTSTEQFWIRDILLRPGSDPRIHTIELTDLDSDPALFVSDLQDAIKK